MNELIQPPVTAWTRYRAEFELVGVCAALSRALGLPLPLMRAAFACGGIFLLAVVPATLVLQLQPLAVFSLAGIGSAALLTYLVAWWSLPADDDEHRAVLGELDTAPLRGHPALHGHASASGTRLKSPLAASLRWVALSGIVGASVAVVILSLLSLAGTGFGAWTRLGLGTGMVASGVALGLLPLSSVDDARWSGTLTTLPRPVIVTTGAGLFLLFAGTLVMVESVYGLWAVVVTGGVALVSTALMSLILVPWVRRLWRGMREETERRAQADQQAEITSHLHDSVLQTLTVIQRESTSNEMRQRLARQQEVELRRWLYGRTGQGSMSAPPPLAVPLSAEAEGEGATAAPAPTASTASTLRESMDQIRTEIEHLHGVEIDIVAVGDAPLSPHLQPLIKAAREATSNAARHAGVGIQVFLDASADPLEIYIRDRGQGFSVNEVPEGRMGVRESIIGRMARAGGYARIAPAIGGGTEVMLTLGLKE